jgi:hypothetical protein
VSGKKPNLCEVKQTELRQRWTVPNQPPTPVVPPHKLHHPQPAALRFLPPDACLRQWAASHLSTSITLYGNAVPPQPLTVRPANKPTRRALRDAIVNATGTNRDEQRNARSHVLRQQIMTTARLRRRPGRATEWHSLHAACPGLHPLAANCVGPIRSVRALVRVGRALRGDSPFAKPAQGVAPFVTPVIPG